MLLGIFMEQYVNILEKKNNFEKIRNVETECVIGDARILDSVQLTICVPTFHRTDTLKETIDSLLHLNDSTISYCILVLDNDPDEAIKDTYNLLYSYNDKRLLYFRNKQNIGMFNNWNRCFELCKSEYVAMLHDDDLLKSDYLNFLEHIFPKIQKNNIACVCFPYDRLISLISKNHSPVSKNNLKEAIRNLVVRLQYKKLTAITNTIVYLMGGNTFAMPTCGILFNRNKVIESGGFNDERFPTADFEFLMYLMENYKLCYAHHSIGIYRWACNESLKPETVKRSFVNQLQCIGFLENKYKYLRLLFGTKIMKAKIDEHENKYSNSITIFNLIRKVIYYVCFLSDSRDIMG